MDGFFLRLAKRALHLRYDYHLSYEEAEEKLGVQRPSIRLRKERLRWTGHLLRSEDSVLYEALVFVQEGGARGRGRPRRRFYDTVKADITERGLNITASSQVRFWQHLAELAADRLGWKTIVEGDAEMDTPV